MLLLFAFALPLALAALLGPFIAAVYLTVKLNRRATTDSPANG